MKGILILIYLFLLLLLVGTGFRNQNRYFIIKVQSNFWSWFKHCFMLIRSFNKYLIDAATSSFINFISSFLCLIFVIFWVIFLLATCLGLVWAGLISFIVFIIFTFFYKGVLRRLTFVKFSISLRSGASTVAGAGFCVHSWTVGALELSLFVVKSSLFITGGAIYLTTVLVIVSPVMYILSKGGGDIKEVSDIFLYNLSRELSEIDGWKDYYDFLDKALRPYFTPPDQFTEGCQNCHPGLFEPNAPHNSGGGDGGQTTKVSESKPVSSKEEKEKDNLWWVAFTTIVGAAGCVICRWLSR